MKKIRVALICSANDPIMVTLPSLLKKNTKSDVLKLIASKKTEKTDLAQYDQIYVLFDIGKHDQYDEFIDFCDLYRNYLKNATLVLSCPIEPKNHKQIMSATEKVKSFCDEVWVQYCDRRKEIISISETRFEKIAPSLLNQMGYDWISQDHLTAFEEYSLIVAPYDPVNYIPPREPDKAGSLLLIAIGTAMISILLILTIALVYYGYVQGLRLAVFLVLGFVMVPAGRGGLIFNRWLNNSFGNYVGLPELLSLIPGFGHIWIKEKFNGFIFLLLFVFPLIGSILIFYLGPSVLVTPLIPFTLMLWIAGSTLAMLDLDTKYDKGEMKNDPGPYLDSFFNKNWLKRRKGIVAIFVCMLFLVCGLVQIFYEFGSRDLNLIITGLSSVIILYLMITSLFFYTEKHLPAVFMAAPKTNARRTIILHGGVLCPRGTKCIAKGYSADVMNMFKYDLKKPLDLSSYDSILIDYSPKMFRKIPRSYLKFFETNKELLEKAGFIHHLRYSLRPSWSLDRLPAWIDERMHSYEEQFNKKYAPCLLLTSDLRIDRVFSKYLSSCLNYEILPPISKEYHPFKNSIVICPDNLNYYANIVTLFSILAVMPFFIYFTGMIFDLNFIVPACLASSLVAAVLLIQIILESLTTRQKIFLYKYTVRFTKPYHIKLCSVIPILGLIGLLLLWGSYFF